MVVAGDLPFELEERGLAKHLLTDDGVSLDLFIILPRQLARLAEDSVGNTDLADVVDDGGFAEGAGIFNIEAHLVRDKRGVLPHTVEVPYGVLEVEGEQLSMISEKPRLDFLINSGVYIVDPSALSLIPRGQPFDAPQLIPLLKNAGRTVVAFPIREYWLDVGRLTDFTQANRDVAEGLLE